MLNRITWQGVVIIAVLVLFLGICVWRDPNAVVPAIGSLIAAIAAWLARSPLSLGAPVDNKKLP